MASEHFSLPAGHLLDDGLLEHSVNVCVLSLLLGEHRRYNHGDLHKLGMGAILHDLGRVVLPDAGGAAPSPATADLLRSHPEVGYELLRRRHELSILTAHVAFQHHELLDGSGYPRGLRGAEIHDFGAIGAVANTYDNLATAAGTPQAAARLRAMAGHQLDHDLVDALLRTVARYPVGTVTALADGSLGVVVAQTEDPERPRVRVVADADHRLTPPVEVDLTARPDMEVVTTLPDYPPRVREQLAAARPA